MASKLRQILDIFEQNAGRPLSVRQVARELDVETGILEGMLHHWVRKGKLREINIDPTECASCGAANSCAYTMQMPKSYELVTGPCCSESE